MKHTIKKIAAAATTLALSAPFAALAQLPDAGQGVNSTTAKTAEAGLPTSGITEVLNVIMLWVLGLVGILSIIAFAIAGVMYLTSAGNEDQAATAKKTMVYAIIGVVVALIGLIVFLTIRSVLTNTGSTF